MCKVIRFLISSVSSWFSQCHTDMSRLSSSVTDTPGSRLGGVVDTLKFTLGAGSLTPVIRENHNLHRNERCR
jgi:hypothetical protein